MVERIEDIIRRLTRNPILLYVFYASISLIVYRNTYEAGMVFDFNGWAGVYEKSNFIDALSSFGYPGLHQLEQITFYSLYKLFGFNGKLWYFTFALLHAFTAIVAFRLIRALSNYTKYSKPDGELDIAFLASFVFLLSPYAADVVVSKVTVHYFLSAIFIYSCLIYYLRFLESRARVELMISCLFFTLGLFSLELSYLIPFAIIFLSIFYATVLNEKTLSFKFIIPFLVIFGAFLVLHKLVIGSVIGHYGTEVHTQFNFGELLDHFFYYFNSFLFFSDFWDYKYKLYQQEFVISYWWAIILASCLIFGLSYFKAFFKNKAIQSAFVYFILFGIGLIPILNLHCVRLQEIENDRYSYLASIFFYALLVQSIFLIKSNFKYLVLGIYLLINCYFLNSNVQAFKEMGIVSKGLIDDFRWADKSKIIILVQPDNNNGARSFTTLVEEGSEFAESLYLERGIDIRDKVELIYEININSTEDSVKIRVLDSTHIQVEIGWWGTWFWKYHNGALPFETSCYHTKMKDNLSFDFILDQPLKADEVIIYSHGKQWRELKF